tara:strand:+ start:7794 stop:8438 length:645 start_codon:yes stop_codon:yes gene_type:complete
MDPNYEWRFENGAPVALIGAFGILLPEEISLERLTEINQDVMERVGKFLDDTSKVNEEFKKGIPKKANELAYSKALLRHEITNYQKETGEIVTIIEDGEILWSSNPLEGLSAPQRNRALIVQVCEDYVRNVVNSTEEFDAMDCDITIGKLFESCKERLRFIEDADNITFVRILMAEGWLVFNNAKGEAICLPYGRCVPHYDTEVDIQHPFWHTL